MQLHTVKIIRSKGGSILSKIKCSECEFGHAATRRFVGVGASAGCESVQTEYHCKHPAIIPAGEVIIFKGATSPRDCPLKWKCRICGCTWHNACDGGCYWVKKDLCSKCAGV